MTNFTVRVELSNATAEDYANLHDTMKAAKYSREVQDNTGSWFHLPTAEYVTEKNISVRAVRDEVKMIASKIKDNPRVLVTQAADRSWSLIKK